MRGRGGGSRANRMADHLMTQRPAALEHQVVMIEVPMALAMAPQPQLAGVFALSRKSALAFEVAAVSGAMVVALAMGAAIAFGVALGLGGDGRRRRGQGGVAGGEGGFGQGGAWSGLGRRTTGQGRRGALFGHRRRRRLNGRGAAAGGKRKGGDQGGGADGPADQRLTHVQSLGSVSYSVNARLSLSAR